MRKVWVVVVNGSQGKIYTAENVNTLVEIINLEHLESHLAAHDLVGDKQGRTTSVNYPGRHIYSDKTPPKLKEKGFFAEEVAHVLERGHKEGKFERVYLIASPQFIGLLKQYLKPGVQSCIVAEIDKDLTSLKGEEIRAYLPPVL